MQTEHGILMNKQIFKERRQIDCFCKLRAAGYTKNFSCFPEFHDRRFLEALGVFSSLFLRSRI